MHAALLDRGPTEEDSNPFARRHLIRKDSISPTFSDEIGTSQMIHVDLLLKVV
jgi:hypothetical protein